MSEQTFKVGDRVRLIPNWKWVQPFRKWSNAGRLATVTTVNVHGGGYHVIKFDCKRPPKWPEDYELAVLPADIELLGGAAE